MLKGIFSKILWSTLLVIFIFSVIAGTSLTFMMQRYVLVSEERSLMQGAQEIRDITEFLLEEGAPQSYGIYQRSLNSYAQQLDSSIFVTDAEGQVVLSSFGDQTPKVGTKLALSVLTAVLKGETLHQWGNLEGTYQEKRLNIILPLVLEGQIQGALFLSSPMPQIDFLMMNVLRILLTSVLFSLVISFMVTFFVSRRIARPIREIRKAAEEFAKGKFETRISENYKGEMAELAVAFNNMAKSLDELEQGRRAFVANVSHELRSPLTTIGGFVEGLLDGTVPEERQGDYLSIVLDEVKRMTRLVNDLLYMERSQEEELHLSVFDLNELIRLVLIGMENRITEKKIGVSVEFCREVDLVQADRDGILRVVTNFLDNAVKFTPFEGRIEIVLKEEGNSVKVSIKNSGEPIPPDILGHMFERFYKGDQSRGINKNGTGLGLYIVKSILASHGQSVRVISNEEQGTIFSFQLPMPD